MVSSHECWQTVFKFGLLHAQVVVSPDSMAFRVSSTKTAVFGGFRCLDCIKAKGGVMWGSAL